MFRMMMGGREHEKEHRIMQPGDVDEDMDMRRRRAAYSDGYDDGRRDAEHEMRRRSSSHWDEEHPESRRGMRPHEEEHPESRQIGFAISPEERKEMRMMMHEMHALHDRMVRMGSASVKKLAKPLEGVLEDAAEIIKDPPSTWKHYLEKGDIAGIVKMEGKELLGALDDGKGPGAVRKEFTHTMAALLLMMSAE